jgi:hypothetical protein
MEQHSSRHINFEQREATDNIRCRLVSLPVDQLRPHPSYVKHQISTSTAQLTALSALGDLVWELPIVVTQTGIVIDGYGRWDLARRHGRQSILCLEYALSEEDALRRLILSHCPVRGLNSYCRSLLTLDLEPSLREKARLNQQIGGENKGFSDLTEADKLEVRSELARVAFVSTGNMTKAKNVRASCDPAIQSAVKSGEIRVHRAYQWSRLLARQQLKNLEEFRGRKGIAVASRRLIQKHVARMAPPELLRPTVGELVKRLIPDRIPLLDAIAVSEIEAPGLVAYFTKEAIGKLKLPGRIVDAK